MWTKTKYLIWLLLFRAACLFMRARSFLVKRALKRDRARYDALQYELMKLAATVRKRLLLHQRWAMRDLHWQLGSYASPVDRFLVFSKRAYREKLRRGRQITNEIISEILAEEKAGK